ncbi:hypothetical protein [Streptomyces sp. ST1015]|uniref:hypothetical protein n=1 Tax=Streptomyces sp. ST1015 TaxID=1848900 RepID=UPI00223A85A3|nr:hypothetical protein [Streptomyces sp. ST1015]
MDGDAVDAGRRVLRAVRVRVGDGNDPGPTDHLVQPPYVVRPHVPGTQHGDTQQLRHVHGSSRELLP